MVFGNGVAAELIATGQEGSYQSTLITAILILNIYYIWSIRHYITDSNTKYIVKIVKRRVPITLLIKNS
jgi:hypothetical protein